MNNTLTKLLTAFFRVVYVFSMISGGEAILKFIRWEEPVYSFLAWVFAMWIADWSDDKLKELNN